MSFKRAVAMVRNWQNYIIAKGDKLYTDVDFDKAVQVVCNYAEMPQLHLSKDRIINLPYIKAYKKGTRTIYEVLWWTIEDGFHIQSTQDEEEAQTIYNEVKKKTEESKKLD